MRKKYTITGMTCSACEAHVTKSVQALPGVRDVNVSLLTNAMTVDFDESAVDQTTIFQAVAEGGYGASEAALAPKAIARASDLMKKRLWISIALFIPLLYVSMGAMLNLPLPAWIATSGHPLSNAILQAALAIPIAIVNGHYFTNGFRRLFKGAPNMDSLIAVGA
ncbi:MAG: cation transporter, partial [Bacillota bacterium]|nr:cation transporter [Bacillota bacterium]